MHSKSQLSQTAALGPQSQSLHIGVEVPQDVVCDGSGKRIMWKKSISQEARIDMVIFYQGLGLEDKTTLGRIAQLLEGLRKRRAELPARRFRRAADLACGAASKEASLCADAAVVA